MHDEGTNSGNGGQYDKARFYRDARQDRSGPLQGMKVIEATTAWAGPMVGCLLADLGCDVVRVDMPGSGGSSNWPPYLAGTNLAVSHQTVNRNKRSIYLDLHREEGQKLFLQMVSSADLVVENFKPGTLEGWGIGFEHCRAVKPDIVYVSVSGWGQFGPMADRPGYDPGALAFGGWMSLNGSTDGPPTKAPTFLADDLAGMHAALGALAALHHRDRTGEGQHVDVALLDSLLFQSNGLLSVGASGGDLKRMGSEVHASVPTNVYACSDRPIFIALILDRHWQRLAQLLGRPDLATAPGFATNPERVQSRDAVNNVVAAWCIQRSAAETLADLNEAGIVCSPVQSYHEAATSAHVQERDMLQRMVLSDGSEAPITGPAAKFSRTPTRVRRAAPIPGSDTDDTLRELGFDDDGLAGLRERGVI